MYFAKLLKALFLSHLTCLLFSPCFGVSLQDAFLYWNPDANWFVNLFASLSTGMLYSFLGGACAFAVMGCLFGIGILIAAHDKYANIGFFRKFVAILFLPFFLFLQFPLEWAAFLRRNVVWKKIPHGERG